MQRSRHPETEWNVQNVGVCALMQETDYDYVTIHSVMFSL